MVYLSVCRAIYDYAPQNANELEIKEGDLLFIIEKTNEEGVADEWWKAKKKAADDEDEEPEGLIPNNYVEEAKPVASAKALYEYSRQTEEELSFPEEAQLQVYDSTDPDWTLVGYNDEYGFVPANYIEVGAKAPAAAPAAAARAIPPPPAAEPAQYEEDEEEEEAPPPQPPRPGSMEVAAPAPTSPAGPAAGLASIMTGGGRLPPPAPAMPPRPDNISPPHETRHVQFTPEPPDEIPPAMPSRPTQRSPPPPQMSSPQSPASPRDSMPPARSTSVRSPGSPQIKTNTFDSMDINGQRPGGYHLYNISEMVSVMGKQKKMPVTLGINLGTGTIFLSPEKKRDGPHQEWTADKLENYSIEGKHVFLDLKKPSKSLDLHAGAKDTAVEIVGALGELAGAARGGGGFSEIINAATSGTASKRGHMLYDFMAQGEDEVDVAEGDEVIVLDDVKSEEWWKVRRVKNGKEGVVPSSYVEISRGGAAAKSASPPPQPVKSAMRRDSSDALKRERERRRAEEEQQKKRDSASKDKPKTKPDPKKLRTWTDRSGTFRVEAQFIGLKDDKIHLHKNNGVKIAVPVDRMSTADLDYVEAATGVSLDEDKPLSDIKRDNSQRKGDSRRDGKKDRSTAGATVVPRTEYDWFDFFLACGVNPQLCERYSQNFSRDSMDESVQEDITPQLLRTLGLKEGDILKVMKHLDSKYNRKGGKKDEAAAGGESGLFAGPGGALKNNTGRDRPTPSSATKNTVDGEALGQGSKKGDRAPTPPQKDGGGGGGGFDDNAWDVKPAKTEPAKAKSPPPPAAVVAPPPKPPPTGVNADLAGLSLLDTPLQPQVTHQDGNKPTPTPTPAFAPPPQQQAAQQQAQQQQLQSQQTGATPAFFNQLPPQQTGLPLQAQQTAMPLQPQATALQQPLGLGGGRQRPQPPNQPQFNQQGQLMPPPPTRPGSAPQQLSPQSTFQPPQLQPQLTGVPQNVTFNPSANPSQSLADMQRMRLQAQMTAQPIQAQPTGFNPNLFQQQQQQPLQPQMTGYMQPQATASPFGDHNRVNSPPQMGGFQPPLVGQQTGMMPSLQPQQTGFNYNGGGFGQSQPPVPQIPQQYAGQSAPFQPQSQFGQAQQQQQQGGFQSQQTGFQGQQTGLQSPAQPLTPQKTGPAPNVSFGLDAVKKLTPQPTGRANLSKATPQNPFGF